MANSKNKITAAAETLITCLFEMAEANTNPVLQVINPDTPLEENKKYPADFLQFNQLGWRAYYHCHPASRAGNHRFSGEHGHFHIFVRVEDDPEKWSHLAALAMDNMGQPLGWFSVNHWVTGESWASADVLTKKLDSIPLILSDSGENSPPNNEQDDLQLLFLRTERWLLAFLALSADKIKLLLQQRDEVLSEKQKEHTSMEIKTDKSLYLLSEIPVNIKELLHVDGKS